MTNAIPVDSFDVPVVLFVFNRVLETKALVESLRAIRPTKIYVVADSPRSDVAGEEQVCAEVLKTFNTIDWDAEVSFNIATRNLGCRDRIVSGIDWVFTVEESAIFLEDDCIPNASFFYFMRSMLKRHSNTQEIGMISGNNYGFYSGIKLTRTYLSKFPHIWGWGTWKRSWDLFDKNLEKWSHSDQRSVVAWATKNPLAIGHWVNRFNKAVKDDSVWDAQWVCTLWMHRLYSLCPPQNLVTNIGFSSAATHTSQASIYQEWPTATIDAQELEEAPWRTWSHDFIDTMIIRLESLLGLIAKFRALKKFSNNLVALFKRRRDNFYEITD